MHPFVQSTLAAMAGDTKRLKKALEQGKTLEAQTLLSEMQTRLAEVCRFAVRLHHEGAGR